MRLFVRFSQVSFATAGLLVATVGSASSEPWTRQCQGPAGTPQEQCFVQQNVTVGRETVMVASFGTPGPDHAPRGTLTIPLNTTLSSGVSIRVDGDPETILRLDHCGRQGCRTTFEISGALLESLQSGKALHTTWQGIDGKAVQLQFDLTGFKAAWTSVALTQ